MNTPKLAIFDMDGLIFDSERLFMGFLQKAAADLGYEITPEKYALTLGVGGDTLAARVREIYGADYPHREVSRRARLAMNDWTEHHTIPVKEGIPELLEFFTARQIPCCVASSTPTDHVNRYLEQAGLGPLFFQDHRRGSGEPQQTGPGDLSAVLPPFRHCPGGRPGAGGFRERPAGCPQRENPGHLHSGYEISSRTIPGLRRVYRRQRPRRDYIFFIRLTISMAVHATS